MWVVPDIKKSRKVANFIRILMAAIRVCTHCLITRSNVGEEIFVFENGNGGACVEEHIITGVILDCGGRCGSLVMLESDFVRVVITINIRSRCGRYWSSRLMMLFSCKRRGRLTIFSSRGAMITIMTWFLAGVACGIWMDLAVIASN